MVAATRREAREHALTLAYELDMRCLDIEEFLAGLPVSPDPYAVTLVSGMARFRVQIDEMLEQFSEHWSLDRMPIVDRTLLRLATYELAHEHEIPVAVVISEAVELAKQYSTTGSGGFVNGLLVRVAAEVRADASHIEDLAE